MRHYHSLPPYDEVTRADLDRDAREYADTTKRLADRTPPRREHKTKRPAGPQWGDDIPIPDDVYAQLVAYETYAPNIRAAVAAHSRRRQ
jgi:hypothetical protein